MSKRKRRVMSEITKRAKAIGCEILDEAIDQMGNIYSLRDRTVSVLNVAAKRIAELEDVIEAIRWVEDEASRVEVCAWCGTGHGETHHEGCGTAKAMGDPIFTVTGGPEGTAVEIGTIDIVFDGPPSHQSGRFVEVEDSQRKSISVGEWVHRDDGYWVLRIPDPRKEESDGV